MQRDPQYDDVVAEVLGFLDERIAWCESRGIPRSRIAVDPGIGFGKTFEHNLKLLRNLERFANLGCALLVGTSRKGFLGTLTGRDGVRADGRPRSSRRWPPAWRARRSCGSTTSRPMVDAIKVWTAVRGWGETR